MHTAWKQRLKSWIVPQVNRTEGDRIEGGRIEGGRVGSVGEQIAPGLYHYQFSRDDGYIRFHLRVERSGASLLLAGASEAVRISRDGTIVMKRLLEGESPETLLHELPKAAEPWVAQGVRIMRELGSPSSRFPVFNLSAPVDDSRDDTELIAPFQADVEMDGSGDLHSILRKLWDAGIPHARFLPSPQTSDDRVVQAVEWAEDLGMIAGVRSPATWLIKADRAKRLAAVGVDYLLAPWGVDPDLHARWFGDSDLGCLEELIGQAQEQEVTSVIEIPLVESSIGGLDEHWPRLLKWQIVHVEVYALARFDSPDGRNPEDGRAAEAAHDSGPVHEVINESGKDMPLDAPRLRQLATWIEEAADEHAFQVTWLPPLGIASSDSVAESVLRGPRAGGDVTIRVLPNGDVLPPRGSRQAAGNLLVDPWDRIWGSEVFLRYRERVEANTRCQQCPGLAICAADCPADPRGWAHE